MVQTCGYTVEQAPVLLGSWSPASDLKVSAENQEDHKHRDPGCECRLKALVQRSSSLNLESVKKRESAEQLLSEGNFMQAWELYNEIGDRVAAQDALERAYRGSKRDSRWVTPEVASEVQLS